MEGLAGRAGRGRQLSLAPHKVLLDVETVVDARLVCQKLGAKCVGATTIEEETRWKGNERHYI